MAAAGGYVSRGAAMADTIKNAACYEESAITVCTLVIRNQKTILT